MAVARIHSFPVISLSAPVLHQNWTTSTDIAIYLNGSTETATLLDQSMAITGLFVADHTSFAPSLRLTRPRSQHYDV
jgi:hypothetical protein